VRLDLIRPEVPTANTTNVPLALCEGDVISWFAEGNGKDPPYGSILQQRVSKHFDNDKIHSARLHVEIAVCSYAMSITRHAIAFRISRRVSFPRHFWEDNSAIRDDHHVAERVGKQLAETRAESGFVSSTMWTPRPN
jgi:hypothetical protein